MKKLTSLIVAFLLPIAIFAQEGELVGWDEKINEFFAWATGPIVATVFYSIPVNGVGLPIVLIILILGASYFTIYFGFPNIRYFGKAVNVVRGEYDDLEEKGAADEEEEDNPDTIKVEGAHHGEVTHFQALTAALSATVGLGNIAGVAVAISIGGAGATFWMIVAGFIGMASKFTECTLGVKYREIGPDGTVYGGPMYYLSKGFKEKGWGGVGKVFAVFFAIMCIGGSFGGGNMFQANQAFKMFESVTGGVGTSVVSGFGWAFGLLMAVLVAIVIIGGIKSIARVTDKIVPFMVVVYVIAALIILAVHFTDIPAAIGEIFKGAFAPAAIGGGFIGVLIQGFKRAAFSNEAGIGSASIAHSAVRTKYPASEGLVALLEPFIDTVVVCTMTALVIIITDTHLNAAEIAGVADLSQLSNDDGVILTSTAFESVLTWFPYILTLAVILFAFSTMISWSYYGFQAWSYLFGKTRASEVTYKLLFCVFVVIGAASSLGAVLDFSDAMIFAMLFPNMIGLFFLAPRVKEELSKYLAAIERSKG